MVAERRRSRREPQAKVYFGRQTDVQCGARSACWKQLELNVAAAAECVGRMGRCGLVPVLGWLVEWCGSALGGIVQDEVKFLL